MNLYFFLAIVCALIGWMKAAGWIGCAGLFLIIGLIDYLFY